MKNYKNRFLRFIGINKPIQLEDDEVRWIKFCKGHYSDTKYDIGVGTFIQRMMPIHEEIYGYSGKDNYRDFLGVMYNKFFNIYMKIRNDGSGDNIDLKTLMSSAMQKKLGNDYELGIERSLQTLYGMIQNNKVVDGGIKRYNL